MIFREKMNQLGKGIDEELKHDAYIQAFNKLAEENPGQYFEVYEDGVARVDSEELTEKLNKRFLELYEEALRGTDGNSP